MPAPIGNKNAEKYTLEWVQDELTALLLELHQNKEIVYLGELFEDKEYPREEFSIWKNRFPEDEVVLHTIKKIKDILETRAVIGGMKNKINCTMTIFHLKNNYNWKDKSEQEITLPDNKLTIEVVHNS